MDCGSLLPLGKGSPAADERLCGLQRRTAIAWAEPWGYDFISRPARQQAAAVRVLPHF
jgi:hypothetical protein